MYPGTYSRTQPDKPAVIHATTGERVTYAELDARSNRLAHALRAHGLKRGDSIALFCENTTVFFDAAWAAFRSGLYVTAINRYLPAAEAAYIARDCNARAFIASASLSEAEGAAALLDEGVLRLALGGPIPGFRSYEETVASQPAGPIADESSGGFMMYSSGTTGKPKGILRPLPDTAPEDGNPAISFGGPALGYSSETVYLSLAPLYHGAPLGHSMSVQQEGGTVVISARFDPEEALSAIETHRVTHSQWVPTMFVRLLKLPPEVRNRYDVSSMRMAIHAAAPCPVEVKRQMIDWWGPVIEEYYGSTEGAGMTRISSAEWLEHPGSVGRGWGAPLHICDENGVELPAGQSGYIYGEVSAPTRYHNDPGKTAEAVHPLHPNWMTVGDIGYLDEDGYLYLTDRKAFMIISGGVNIYPQQIEDALALHPAIADVAVIGVPNPDLGEEVKAVVEPAPGVQPSPALAQEIMDHVGTRLGKQLTPRSVDFVDALPRLPTGKLYKKALRDRYWAEAGASAGHAAPA